MMESDTIKLFLVPPDFTGMVKGLGIGLESRQEVEIGDKFNGHRSCEYHTQYMSINTLLRTDSLTIARRGS